MVNMERGLGLELEQELEELGLNMAWSCRSWS